ncbi:MAG: histidine phosphatase family protein [Chitinophagales bacterium]|nr:histidine phosphatase family protein [Chitinophagales bacterium]
MQKNIYIIRHGQTDFNIREVVQGRGINSDINTTGIAQAEAFYQAYKNIPFDVVYTSKLKRTQQTVQSFLNDNFNHIIRESIDEIDWGIFEGIEHHPTLKEKYYNIINEWKNGNLTIKIEGGESAYDLQQRLLPFIEEIKSSEYQNILICTHGRTLRALLCLFNNETIANMDNYSHSNTCLYQLALNNDTIELILSNNINHLNTINVD